MVSTLEMITSRQILKISEQWIPAHGVRTDVFENPDSSDIRDLYKSIKESDKFVRFYADAKTQKVYVWNGHEAIHAEVMKGLGFSGSYQQALDTPYLLIGYGKIQGGRIALYNQDDSIRKVSGAIDILNSYFQWDLSPKAVKSRFGPYITEEKTWLLQFFKYNWSFVDRYISGIGNYINTEKKRFQDWLNLHSNF